MNNENEHNDDVAYGHVLKYTGIFGGVQGLTLLMNIVRNKVAAVLLGPAGLGLNDLYVNFANLINMSTNFGLSFSAVKHIAELHEQGNRTETERCVTVIRTWCLLTALLGMSVAMAAAPFIPWTSMSNIMLLSPMIGVLTMTGGELAILKGLKQLNKVALTSLLGAFVTLLVCVPLFAWLRNEGIVFALLLGNIAVLAVHLYFSTRLYPYRISLGSGSVVREGMPMVKLGIAYIVAGVMGAGSEYIIRSFIEMQGSTADVGLYSSGYKLSISYASLIFVAIEADFFPRLASMNNDVRRSNRNINQQIEVCLLLIAPFLVLFVTAMPLILQLLYSNRFIDAVPMSICASFHMFFKAMTLPVAYLPLARGDSRTYMLTELAYAVFVAVTIPLTYAHFGLAASGICLSVAGLFECLMIHILYRRLYGFRFRCTNLGNYVTQFILLLITVLACFHLSGWHQYAVCAVSFTISLLISFRILRNSRIIDHKSIGHKSINHKLWF